MTTAAAPVGERTAAPPGPCWRWPWPRWPASSPPSPSWSWRPAPSARGLRHLLLRPRARPARRDAGQLGLRHRPHPRRQPRPRALPDGYADLVALRLGCAVAGLGGLAVVLAVRGDAAHRRRAGCSCCSRCRSPLDTLGDAGRAAAAAVGRQSAVAGVLVVQRAATAVVAVTRWPPAAGLVGLGVGFARRQRRRGCRRPRRRRPARRAAATCAAPTSPAPGSWCGTPWPSASTAWSAPRCSASTPCCSARSPAPPRSAATPPPTACSRRSCSSPGPSPGRCSRRWRRPARHWQMRRAVERGVTVCAFVFVPYARAAGPARRRPAAPAVRRRVHRPRRHGAGLARRRAAAVRHRLPGRLRALRAGPLGAVLVGSLLARWRSTSG